MKKKLLFLAISVLMTYSYTVAQNTSLRFGIGLHANLVNIPLNIENFSSSVNGVYAFFTPTEKLFIRLGYEDRILHELKLKQYTNNPGLMLGVGYHVYQNSENTFALEASAKYANAFKNFSSFNNFNAELGVKTFFFNIAYIGTGIRLSHNNDNQLFIIESTNTLGWYWDIGLQLSLYKRE